MDFLEVFIFSVAIIHFIFVLTLFFILLICQSVQTYFLYWCYLLHLLKRT